MARLSIALLIAAAVVVCAAAATLTGAPTPRPPRPAVAVRPARVAVTPAAPRLSHAEIDRQDRVSASHQRRESRALDDRPLLSELPLELGPIRIELAGLTRDGRRTRLRLSGPDERAARRGYAQVLDALGDPGTAYDTQWVP